MMPLLKRFSGLRWKLAFSYVGVTLATVLALEAIFLLVMGIAGKWIGEQWVAQSALSNARQVAQLAADPLESGAADRLAQVLYQPVGVVFKVGITDEASNELIWYEPRVITGRDGRVIASNQPEHYPAGSQFQEPAWPEAVNLVSKTLADGSETTGRSEALKVFAVVVPITGSEGQSLGVLYYQQPLVNIDSWSPANLAGPLVSATLLLLPCMIPLGLIFGFVTATGFTHRLRRLAQASRALASGSLERRVQDASGDEIGQLTQQFNQMAEQLETDTIRLRDLAEHNARLAQQAQRLAALEERHRLARDLHDGIKQNLFGVNLAIAAAQNLLDTDLEAAQSKLLEAKDHSRQAQAEMQALLDELRPAGLDERGLVAALDDYLAAFERRQGIQVEWRPVQSLSLPLTHEQALFRIAQEALANVVRHAQATRVSVELEATPETVTLKVCDNGQGFDPSTIKAGVSSGLQGMCERVAELNGTITVASAPNAGTQLKACLPLPGQVN